MPYYGQDFRLTRQAESAAKGDSSLLRLPDTAPRGSPQALELGFPACLGRDGPPEVELLGRRPSASLRIKKPSRVQMAHLVPVRGSKSRGAPMETPEHKRTPKPNCPPVVSSTQNRSESHRRAWAYGERSTAPPQRSEQDIQKGNKISPFPNRGLDSPQPPPPRCILTR